MSRRDSPSAGAGISRRYRSVGTAIAMLTRAATANAAIQSRPRSAAADDNDVVVVVGPTVSNAPSSARRTSRMSATRCFGSFRRHTRSTWLTRAGTVDGSASKSGSRCRIFESVIDTSSSPNARVARQHLVEHAPNAQMSVRLSTIFPRACSGLMYAAVPRIIPAVSWRARCVGDMRHAWRRARRGLHRLRQPKVEHFHRAVGRTLMFAGFRSR